MTKEEIMALDADGIEARTAEIRKMAEAEDADCAALLDELDAIEERKAAIKQAAENRAALAAKVAQGEVGENTAPVIEKREEVKTMTEKEIRSSAEYGVAYLKAIKTGDDKEARALLSTNVSGGYVPVPTQLETEIKTAWEEARLMGLVKHTYYSGNVKVGFELSATGAVIHTEGSAAPDEEVVTIGTVELKAESIKKWITVSDEALEGTTVDTIGYLYKEIAQKIVEKAEEILVACIIDAPAAATATACAVPTYTASALAVDTVTLALAELSGQARNVVLAMNRRTYAALKATGKKANYNVDPFDGVTVVFTDKLPAFSAASTGDTYIIGGDFGYGFQANFPNGNDMSIKVDDLSLAEKDLVKIVGRQYVGMGVVANNAFVKVVK